MQEIRDVKVLLNKALKLQDLMLQYKMNPTEKSNEIFLKFTSVWGDMLANHFLGKYDNASDLIWALDPNNLQLFIDKY